MTDPQPPDSKARSQAQFSQHADQYVTSKTNASGNDLDRLVEIAGAQPTWRVLDVATGGGHTALRFAPHVAAVVATDLTPKMLATAEKHLTAQGAHNVTFQQADAEALPFDDASFNLVTCRIAPHHFPNVARFVQESARVLKPGGLLLVQDHVLPEDEAAAAHIEAFEAKRDPSHHRAYSEAEWRDLFTAAGLKVEHTEQVVKRHNFIEWAERMGNSAEVVSELIAMLPGGPPEAVAWMDPEAWGTPSATFVNRHIIIAGRKP